LSRLKTSRHPNPATADPIMPHQFATNDEPLIVGTGNRKKAAELADLLSPLNVRWQTLADTVDPLEVEEAGDSFAANAALKASRQAAHLGRWVLADDSGLMVDALVGAPGVYSARYAGPDATDERNRQKLLAALDGVAWERRDAHFECHLALADPQGQIVATAHGRCSGRIRFEPAGSGGFGYDPLFEVLETHRTFAELSPVVKSCLSHRARAMYRMLPRIEILAAEGHWGTRG
jgi:XTP/dITP diphosphohydrolase